ncbi:ribosome rescue GTPase HflX [Alkalilimnicola ehrlichii]|uniref:ribosome rescue GTPase HflX n=1 Tax=Alkalilimnicola ehrlichii TaxID=351052 RepID=UPI0021621BB5|nr:ribosome rescue GTPase HflX [Alkalilimnicola ehrlichii]
MFARPGGGERAIVVHLDLGEGDATETVAEFTALAESAGAKVVETSISRRKAPDARFFIGKGKVAELAELIAAGELDLVLLNHDVSPAQERNLERALQCRVLDRTGLILDIFAQRARSFEGKLQVELAQLNHIASRLVRGWSHLERQKGGIGLRGPGETQLELDRRMLGLRIKQLQRKLQKVRKQRDQGRQARRKRELPAISLVGYTNAGKSTLFNRVTEASVYAADQLFATLDTTLRRLELDNGQELILADTVGFIRDLPHQLVEAFRSTLEEVAEADLLLHVIDAASPTRDEEVRQVEAVLAELGAADVPVLRVYNKVDLLGRGAGIVRNGQGDPVEVWLSAEAGEGVDLLLEVLAERVGAARVRGLVRLPPAEGRLRARFYALGDVIEEQVDDQGASLLKVDLPRRDLDRLYRKEGLTAPLEPIEAGGV